MDQDMVNISKQRLNDSKHRLECNFASPTIPGYGIDQLFHDGDQRFFQIKCPSCGKHTCLVRDFPNSILCINGRWRRTCVHCKGEIRTDQGKFIAEYPDRRDASFWVSGLMSPNADLEEYMHRFHNSEGSALAEFERSILGRATIEASCQLSVADVKACRGNQGLSMFSSAECCIGIDTGNGLHVVVGYRTAEMTYRILFMAHIESKDISFDPYAQVHDICEKMNVRCGVVDIGPDIHAVRRFQTEEHFDTYRCIYSDTQHKTPQFDHNDKVVRCNRNEIADKVHGIVIGGNIVIPRGCYEVDEYCKHLTKMAKVTEKNPDTGIPKTRWVKVGDHIDHYLHATMYMVLACSERSPVRDGMPPKPIKLKNKFHV